MLKAMTTPSKYDTYTSPLAERNASPAMLRLWSPRHKFNTWRRIWLAVAEAQHEITKDWGKTEAASHAGSAPLVTTEQVEELRAVVQRGITDDEIRLAEKYERELRHDVMAHVHALGDACPKAKGIIHLGMTSQDVVCNADLEVLQRSINLVDNKVACVQMDLAVAAANWNHLPTLAFTHYQAAQPLTVGRRFAQWCQDLELCRERVLRDYMWLYNTYRGLRGATGTQASYKELLRDDNSVYGLEARFIHFRTENFPWPSDQEEAERFNWQLRKAAMKAAAFKAAGIDDSENHYKEELDKLEAMDDQQRRTRLVTWYRTYHTLGLTTQTYPRVIDTFILADLASVAAVLHKIATDIRLLCNRKELDEPFEDKQIGSSAMPYKRNPMRCERICGLTRFVMNLVGNAYDTAATQWLERTLDDSSNRRLSLPEAFLALDGALDLMHNVASGLIVHEAMVKKNLMAELPFMATENIMMACVKLGGDRQEYHELIRVHAQAAGLRVKHEGLDNDLLERLKNDKHFWSVKRGGPLREELDWEGLMDPMKYIGRSVEQTERFIKEVIEPLREQYGEAIAKLEESGPRV